MRICKKLVSLILSALFMFSSAFVLAFAADEITETESETIASENFFLSLSDMIVEYDLNSFDSSVVSGKAPTNRLVVKTVTNDALTDTQGAKAVLEGWNSIHILQYSNETEANDALEYYQAQDYVIYAEMDVYYSCSSGTMTGESFEYTATEENLSWGTSAVNLDYLNNLVVESGRVSEDDEVVVAVFDTGLLESHAIFDDKDRICKGYNVFEGNSDTSDEGDTSLESIGHGTHVSGIIYENTLPNVKIRPYRVNLEHGQDSYDTAMTILGTAIYTAVDIGDDLINVSMKWGAYGNSYITEAIEYAYDNNVPLIAAAGNYSINASTTYPANIENVITVSAVDETFTPADFSNYGSCVDIAAPGVKIASACKNPYIILEASGTSMAAPFVSAAVATLKLIYPDISSKKITDILKTSVYTPSGWKTKYGAGVLNCESFMSIGKTPTPQIRFNSEGKIAITSPSPNATIYYTTDGSEPIVGVSDVYSSPFSTSGVVSVRAIAYEAENFQSDEATLPIRWSVYEEVYYKETVTFDELKVPKNAKIISVYSSDENVVTVNKTEREIYATGTGEATVYIYLENNRRMTVFITSEYHIFQWFIILFLWGYFWYI